MHYFVSYRTTFPAASIKLNFNAISPNNFAKNLDIIFGLMSVDYKKP